MSVSPAEFLKWLYVFDVPFGGGGGGGVTESQVQQGAFNNGSVTYAADNYHVILSPPVTLLTDGLSIIFTSPHNNTGNTPTLQVNGLAPVDIVLAGDNVKTEPPINSYTMALRIRFNYKIRVFPKPIRF